MFHIDHKRTDPIYKQIINQIKEQVARGILQLGDQIPTVRELASQLIVNPNTVSKAYQELERDDLIITIRGKGTFIAKQERADIPTKTIEEIHDKVKQVVIEGYYAGIGSQAMQDLVACYYNQLGGQS